MADDRREVGKSGEDLACAALERAGFEVLARQFRTRSGEIDIVATDRHTVVFVEVKARRSDHFGSGADAVTWWKQHRIARVAQEFISRHRLLGRPCRFDVAVVDFAADPPTVELVRGAFLAPPN